MHFPDHLRLEPDDVLLQRIAADHIGSFLRDDERLGLVVELLEVFVTKTGADLADTLEVPRLRVEARTQVGAEDARALAPARVGTDDDQI